MRKPTAAGPPVHRVPYCEACGREGVPLTPHVIKGVPMDLCPDPAECRRCWLAQEAKR